MEHPINPTGHQWVVLPELCRKRQRKTRWGGQIGGSVGGGEELRKRKGRREKGGRVDIVWWLLMDVMVDSDEGGGAWSEFGG